MDKRVGEILRFLVAPRHEFAPAIWRVSWTLLSRNTSTSVDFQRSFKLIQRTQFAPKEFEDTHTTGVASHVSIVTIPDIPKSTQGYQMSEVTFKCIRLDSYQKFKIHAQTKSIQICQLPESGIKI